MSTENSETSDGWVSPIANFHQHFRQQISSLQSHVDNLSNTELPFAERKALSEEATASVVRLSSELADASGELASYDQRSYNQAIKVLQDKLAMTQASNAPKAKFSFKNKKLAAPSSETNSAATSRSVTPSHLQDTLSGFTRGRPVPAMAGPPVFLTSQEPSPERDVPGISVEEPDLFVVTINEKENTYVRHQTPTPHPVDPTKPHYAQTYVVSKIKSSIVNLTPDARTLPPSALTLNTIYSSFVLAPDVRGAVHVTDMRDTVILLSCHQFRMHNSHNVDVYLFCSNRPIIEDCTDIRFTRLPSMFLESKKQQDSGSVQQKQNAFDQVDDFKWLRTEASPNWRLMKMNEEVKEDVWLGLFEQFSKLDKQGSHDEAPVTPQMVLERIGLSTRSKA